MTEFELFNALRAHYPKQEYALLPQVANGTGSRATRHADAIAMGLWPSRGIHIHGFEIKSYRGDWIRELRNPAKAEEIAQYCNYWWIVAGGPFISREELPKPWGLLIFDKAKGSLDRAKSAEFSNAIIPNLPFIAGMLRKAQDVLTPESVIKEAFNDGLKEGREQEKLTNQSAQREYQELIVRVKAFEKASGIDINNKNRWKDAHQIGAAVNLVLNGSLLRDREALLTIARRIVRDLDGDISTGVTA